MFGLSKSPNALFPMWIGAVSLIQLGTNLFGAWEYEFEPPLLLPILLLVASVSYTLATWNRLRLRHDPLDYVLVLLLTILADALMNTGVFPLDAVFIDALINSAALLTTTAISVFPALERLPVHYHYYRAFVQLLGALWMVQFVVVAIPARIMIGLANSDGVDIQEDPAFQALLNRLWLSVLWVLVIMTLLASVALYLSGLAVDDAFFLASATASLGGLMHYDASIGDFGAPTQMVCALVMLIAATNWLLHLRTLSTGTLRHYWHSQELRLFLAIIASSIVVCLLYFALINGREQMPELRDLRTMTIYVISTVTTTGLATDDYQLMGTGIMGLTLILALLGGCSGTPSGGIKVARVLFQAKSIALIFSGRRFTRTGNLTISLSSLQYLQVFTTFFLLLLFISVLVLAVTGLDLTTSFSVSVMTLTNLGVGLGNNAGWAGNFERFNDASKFWIIFLMIAGRLEMGLVFVFASARYWMSPETMGVER